MTRCTCGQIPCRCGATLAHPFDTPAPLDFLTDSTVSDQTLDDAPLPISFEPPPPTDVAEDENATSEVAPTRRFDVPFELLEATRDGDAIPPPISFDDVPVAPTGEVTGKFSLDRFLSATGDVLVLGDPTRIVETARIRSVSGEGEDTPTPVEHRICIGADIEQLLGGDVVLSPISGAPVVELSAFEAFVLKELDGRRTTAELSSRTGLSVGDLRIALALLADKGQLARVVRRPVQLAPAPTPDGDDPFRTVGDFSRRVPAETARLDVAPPTMALVEGPPVVAAAESSPAVMPLPSSAFTPLPLPNEDDTQPLPAPAPPAEVAPTTTTTTTTAAPRPSGLHALGPASVLRWSGPTPTDLSPIEAHVVRFIDGHRALHDLGGATALGAGDLQMAIEHLLRRGVIEIGWATAQRPPPSAALPQGVLPLPGATLTPARTPTPAPFAAPASPPTSTPTPTPATASATTTTSSVGARPPVPRTPTPPPVVRDLPRTQTPPPPVGLDAVAPAEIRAVAMPRASTRPQLEGVLQAAARAEQQGDLERAVFHLKKAVSLAPDSAVAYNRLGILLARQKDLRGATAALGRAMELAPEDPTIVANFTRMAALADRAGPADDKKSLWSRLRR